MEGAAIAAIIVPIGIAVVGALIKPLIGHFIVIHSRWYLVPIQDALINECAEGTASQSA